MMVPLHLFINYENCFIHISKGNKLELKFFENFQTTDNYDFLYIACLNGKDTFIVKKENEILRYLEFCIKGKGKFNDKLFEVSFYKELESANDKFSLNKLSDRLFYKNYENFFNYYDYQRVKFFRGIIRYKLAKFYYKNNDLSRALKTLKELENFSDFRIKFIALGLKNEIYQKLNYKTTEIKVDVNVEDGIYIRGMDTVLNYENLKIHKMPIVCQLDFPELYIVKDRRLIFWDSPIIH